MNESDPELNEDYISDIELEENAGEAIIRSRIRFEITTPIKIKRIVFWTLYIMAFYFFAARNSGYEYFISAIGTSQVPSGTKFFFSLFLLVVCSNIAGPIAGGFGALLGDLIFQIVTIQTVRIEYLVVAVLIGVTSGLFRFNKDKTLKQMGVMKLFYSLVGAAVVSLGIMFLVGWLRYPSVDWGTELGQAMQFNYIQFFFAELVSYLFLGPLAIAIIDRILRWASNSDGIAYRFFFTHHYEEQADHAIPLDLGGYIFFVCTRCSGTISGIILIVFVDYALLDFNGFEIITPTIAFILSIVFTIPALADWGTQKLQFRTSNDTVRLLTGLFLGAAIHMLVLAVEQYVWGVVIILVVFFAAFFIMFFLGNRKLRRFITKRINKSVRHDEDSTQ